MQQSSCEHRAAGADRMTVRDGTAFDVDDISVQTKVFRDCDCDRRESLVDLDPPDIGRFPAGAVERLLHRRHWT
jgi:hypothetical protein